jgi:hypothetical protein
MFSKRFLPPTVIDILIIIVMSVGIIWAYLIYVDIQKRDENDYNLLSMKSTYLIDPNAVDTNGATVTSTSGNTSTSSGSLTSTLTSMVGGIGGTCVGNDCCPAGKSYDPSTNKCTV